MTILATQTWVTPADYLIERSSFGGIALVWWKMCLLSAGPDTKMREVPFGGYKVRMTIDSDFWDHRSSAWRHDQIVTNLYAEAPGSSTPIAIGTCNRQVTFFPSLRQYWIIVQCTPSDAHYMFFTFPPATENAGSLLYPSGLPSVFYSDPDYPGAILPPPMC
jgi:hypothetical protein